MTLTTQRPIRWGLLGAGVISGKFATGLSVLPDAELTAIAARDGERAAAFAARHGVRRHYAGYEALFADPEIDVVYIGVIHPEHYPLALRALEAGKHLLVEKPFTMNRAQAARVLALARERRRFVMEAMWTRFNPVSLRVRDWVREGRIGTLRLVRAAFGYNVGETAAAREGRALKRELGGGALLDVGIYTLSLAGLLLGWEPDRVRGVADLDPVTGVDRVASVQLAYPSGAVCELSSAVACALDHSAWIYGTEGVIEIPRFWNPFEAVIRRTDDVSEATPLDRVYGLPSGGAVERFRPEIVGNAYGYEAAEVMRCIRAGLTESPDMTHAETLAWMGVMDRLRTDWGLDYGEAERV
ncbi:MAG: Gfo/Idh/MocA family oxidoreductase [Bacillota bacterium]|nr:Gfo/Idh/MocA family oxidoreductase [Bacillota bacterium]